MTDIQNRLCKSIIIIGLSSAKIPPNEKKRRGEAVADLDVMRHPLCPRLTSQHQKSQAGQPLHYENFLVGSMPYTRSS